MSAARDTARILAGMSGAAPTAPRTPTRNDGSGDNDVEEVQVQAVAVDPGGETREAEQPAGGYPSDAEEDALPAELVAEDATVDAAEDDENEPPLEDAEAAVGDDCCVSVFGTAASMTAAADAAIAAHGGAVGAANGRVVGGAARRGLPRGTDSRSRSRAITAVSAR